MFKTSEELATYYSALSLPSNIVSSYSRMIDKWLEHNGIEWTVNRCKSIYTDFIRFHAGEEPVGLWYKKNRKGLPSGIHSRLFELSLRKKNKFSCMTLLRSYTRFISKETTSQQTDKFLLGVNAPISEIDSSISDNLISAGLKYIGVTRSVISQPSYLSYTPSPGRRLPTCWGTTLPEEGNWQGQWETMVQTKVGIHLMAKYKTIFRDVKKGFHSIQIGVTSFAPQGIDAVGKIGLIQEPGFKLRAVANPNRVYQIALKPLGDIIYDTLKTLPWDCTFDQSKATPHLQKHLQESRRAYCIDLTGATDYFPLSLQLSLLSKLFPDHSDYISLFDELSRSPWIFQDTVIQWKRGQPLGLFPSFGSFALCHGLLLLSLCPNGYENNFFVLGDDVVILDDNLALAYLKVLKALRCPVSISKSINSNKIIEFGGKIISKDFVFPQLKWRQLSDDNFIDIVKLLGMKALRLLRPRQRKVVKAIWDIPDFVGGLGFNPDGISLSDRYEKYLTLFGEDSGTFLMSYDRKFNQFFNEEVKSPYSRNHLYWDDSKLSDLDQRSAALCSRYLPMFVKMYGVMGTNLYSVVPNKDVLPISGFAGERQTLLTRLERTIA